MLKGPGPTSIGIVNRLKWGCEMCSKKVFNEKCQKYIGLINGFWASTRFKELLKTSFFREREGERERDGERDM